MVVRKFGLLWRGSSSSTESHTSRETRCTIFLFILPPTTYPRRLQVWTRWYRFYDSFVLVFKEKVLNIGTRKLTASKRTCSSSTTLWENYTLFNLVHAESLISERWGWSGWTKPIELTAFVALSLNALWDFSFFVILRAFLAFSSFVLQSMTRVATEWCLRDNQIQENKEENFLFPTSKY